MNWMLFTISNEQIKESLDKLQTKVESLENMKELQDKVVSMQDHQISFLNDSIANMWQPIAIVAGIAGLVITGAFAYVSILHHQAKRKKDEVEQLIQQSHSIATIAQEKINELDQKQMLLQKQANTIDNKQKLDMKFNYIKKDLDFLYKRQEKDRHICSPDEKEEFNDFTYNTSELEAKYLLLFSNLSNKIFRDIDITDDDIQQVEKLTVDVQKIMEDYISFKLNLRLRRGEN
ncbi:hypothetical protein IIC_04573 [Bacillus cereus VD021]|uniref:SpbB protein n=1 Tax=Bacillus cereus VD021 TaxID=1053224 RepID=R8HCX7_BACCE|nr:hypothetical protein [Bacillus cereus]EOO70728.1 hypothetical protein IIC_04573 [Bacillus cereus VD021]